MPRHEGAESKALKTLKPSEPYTPQTSMWLYTLNETPTPKPLKQANHPQIKPKLHQALSNAQAHPFRV